MFDDLDKTLEALLKRGVPAPPKSRLTISFDPPDEAFPSGSVNLPAINCFLYDVRENRELRNNERVVVRQQDGGAVQMRPAVRVDCTYSITAWTKESAAEEHRLLGDVMRTLIQASTLPADVLQGVLRNEDAPPIVGSLYAGPAPGVSERWSVVGGRPKATLHYTITIPVQSHKPERVTLVTERTLIVNVMGADRALSDQEE